MLLRWLALTIAVVALASTELRAADPPKADAPKVDAPKADAPKVDAPKADALPAPKPIVIPMIPGSGQIRTDRYAVWQAYQVDRFGQFRPLVILPPNGHAYYYYNGAPFPWASVYENNFLRVYVGQ